MVQCRPSGDQITRVISTAKIVVLEDPPKPVAGQALPGGRGTWMTEAEAKAAVEAELTAVAARGK